MHSMGSISPSLTTDRIPSEWGKSLRILLFHLGAIRFCRSRMESHRRSDTLAERLLQRRKQFRTCHTGSKRVCSLRSQHQGIEKLLHTERMADIGLCPADMESDDGSGSPDRRNMPLIQMTILTSDIDSMKFTGIPENQQSSTNKIVRI